MNPARVAPARGKFHPDEALAHIVRGILTELRRKDPSDAEGSKQREEISQALTESKGRVGGSQGAAARLGLKRTTLIARMKKLGIASRDFV